ncbi:hypothetical protein AAHA92_20876 [Salvia divinorum]|uniref:Uncharacterized protein n=1 Tax=Salvia divinorum TaxID=28513 RepID=A0ABD1GIN2_SALDI
MVGDSVAPNLCGHDHKDGSMSERDCVLLRRLEQHLDRRFDSLQTQIEGVTTRLETLEMDVGSSSRINRIRRENQRHHRRVVCKEQPSEVESTDSEHSHRSNRSRVPLKSKRSQHSTSDSSEVLPLRAYRSHVEHVSREANSNLAGKEVDDEEAEFCDPDEDGSVNDDDPNDDLLAGVCRRVLTAPKVEDSQTQRHQLFRTCCTIKGKIFTILIDGESMENIIGGKVARTLELQMEPHPNPYTLGWIATTSGGIRVAQCCKFDVSSCHDGRTNVYSFEKEEQTQCLH